MSPNFRDQLQSALATQYVLERELTGGGMSRVYVATEKALGRTVVIKVLPPDLAAGVNRERFKREIQLAAQLHHPHIVPLFSAGELGELLYYTMPYIEGESLRTALERKRLFSVREAVRIFHDVVDALAYAHARGVIHRDIKPGNVLTMGAHSLVTDFGVAKAISASLPMAGLTTAGIAIGTPAYMAPEQLAGDPDADHRVDIYAAGLLVYELLTGESPFSASSPQATLAAQLTRNPEPLHIVRPEVPQPFSAIIMRCLQKSPDERPESAGRLLAELDDLSTARSGTSGMAAPADADAGAREPATLPAHVGAPGGAGSPQDTLPLGASRDRRGLRPVAIAAVAITVAAVGAAAWQSSRDRAAVSARADSLGAGTVAAAAGAGASVAASGAAAGASARDSATQRAVVVDQPMRAPLVLSRGDSLAIAEAVRKRRGEENRSPADAQQGISVDSLRAEFYRAIADSMRRAMEALSKHRVQVDVPEVRLQAPQPPRVTTVAPVLPPSSSGRIRVAVGRLQNGTGRPDLDALAPVIGDSLRKLLGGPHPYEVVDLSASRVAGMAATNPVALGWTLRADIVIGGMYFLRRDDALRIQLQAYDVKRGTVLKTARSQDAPIASPLIHLRDLAAEMAGDLADVVERVEELRAADAERERQRLELERRRLEQARTRQQPARAPRPPPRPDP